MNSSRLVWRVALSVGLTAGVGARPAAGQATPAAPAAGASSIGTASGQTPAASPGSASGLEPIPPAVKTSASAVAAGAPQITAAISAALTVLADDSQPAAQAGARDYLIAQDGSSAGAGGGSPAYRQAYAADLNPLLLAFVTNPASGLRAKLDAGVVAEQVAGASTTAALQPTVEALLADPNPAVALQGIKASGAVLQAVLLNRAAAAKQQITPKIVAIVKANTTGELAQPTIEEAYKALTAPGLAAPTVVPALADDLMELASFREGQYKAGPVVSPGLDASAPLVLMAKGSWPGLKAPQQSRAMQLWLDLTSLMAQRGTTVADPGDYFTGVAHCGFVLQSLTQFGSGALPNQDVYNAAARIAGVTIGSGKQAVLAVAGPEGMAAEGGVFRAITAIPPFKSLTVPPSILGASAPAAAANAP